MIRSEEAGPRPEDGVQPWKRVPPGFRVKRKGDGRTAQAAAAARRTRSGAGDLLRIGAATMFWDTRDALRARPRRRTPVLRLTAR